MGSVAGYKVPVHEKTDQKLCDNGSGAAEVQIADPVFACVVAKVMCRNVHASGKGHGSVTDQEFAVRAQIDVEAWWEQSWRQKAGYADTGGTQAGHPAEQRQSHPERADAVDKQADVKAASCSVHEGFGKEPADFVVTENEGGKIDTLPGCTDSFKHLRIGFFTVVQRSNRVAAHDAAVGQAPAWACRGAKAVRQIRNGNAAAWCIRKKAFHQGSGCTQCCLGGPGHHACGPAFHPGYAEQEIEQRSKKRSEQAHGSPAQRGTRVAFVEQGMSCGQPRKGMDNGGYKANSFPACLHDGLCKVGVSADGCLKILA